MVLGGFFFFNDTATTEIYTLSLHDALPILRQAPDDRDARWELGRAYAILGAHEEARSEEHTSELQSRLHLVCRLLLEKKKARRTECRTDRRSNLPDPTDCATYTQTNPASAA